MRLIRYTFFLATVFFILHANAKAIERPEAMLERVTAQMLHALKQNDKEIKSNNLKLVAIVDQILVPHVDLNDMSRWVVGRNAWLKSNASQRARFKNEFKDLMIRTYSSSLKAYSDQEIIYLPVRSNIETKKRVQVSSKILESGRAPILVSYRLVKKDSTWKVYDIIIEGVSLLKGFRSQFAEDIKQHGMDFVIEKMKTHNMKPLS